MNPEILIYYCVMAKRLIKQIKRELKSLKEQNEMKDLTKILKEGDEVYYTVSGEMHSVNIDDHEKFPIDLLDYDSAAILTRFGRRHDKGECLIFPSKEERNWNNFKRKEEFKRGDLCAFWDDYHVKENYKMIGVFYNNRNDAYPFQSAGLENGKLIHQTNWKYCEKIDINELLNK